MQIIINESIKNIIKLSNISELRLELETNIIVVNDFFKLIIGRMIYIALT